MIKIFTSVFLATIGLLILIDSYNTGWFGIVTGIPCLAMSFWLMRTASAREGERDGE